MSEFEDNLWQEILQTHGRQLAALRRPPGEHESSRVRWARPRVVGAGAGLAVLAALAAVLVLSATASSPAYAVTRNADGTVTVKLLRVSGIPAANQKLVTMGVRARIVRAVAMAKSVAAMHACPAKQAVAARTVTFAPSSIPHNRVMLLTADGTAHLRYAVPAAAATAAAAAANQAVKAVRVPGMYAAGPGRPFPAAAAVAMARARIVAKAVHLAPLKRGSGKVRFMVPADVKPLPAMPVTVVTVKPAAARSIHQVLVYCSGAVPLPAAPVPAPAPAK